MKKYFFILILVFMPIFCFAQSSTIRGEPGPPEILDDTIDKPGAEFAKIPLEEIPEGYDAVIDLLENSFGNRRPDAICLLNSPAGGKALLKLVLDPAKTEFTKARIELESGEKLEGHILNIGDSSTNNGFAGDGATQSRDSEVQIVDGNLAIYADDHCPVAEEKKLVTIKDFAKPGAVITIEISNNTVSWQSNNGEIESIESPYLFSLAGQSDKEGPVNYDIFVALNRVISGSYRSGTGISKARIKLFYQ
ncbi:MAG: hypothetical protein ACQETH_15710 [Candidatus Rifleibacteriota bacterium]